MKDFVRANIFVSGRVQGVFYRKGAQKKARELGVTGWAHNLVDNRVQIVAEGEKQNIESFIAWCKQGTPMAKVEQCEVEFEEYKKEFPDFTIREFGF